MKRIIIIGGPKTGKTTAGKYYARTVCENFELRHTDALIDMPWSMASDKVAEWITELNASWSSCSIEGGAGWCIEGTTAVRGLRKWLAANPEGRPCDMVVFFDQPYIELLPGQLSMAKGIVTIWNGIADDLIHRGVSILFSPSIPVTPEISDHWTKEEVPA